MAVPVNLVGGAAVLTLVPPDVSAQAMTPSKAFAILLLTPVATVLGGVVATVRVHLRSPPVRLAKALVVPSDVGAHRLRQLAKDRCAPSMRA